MIDNVVTRVWSLVAAALLLVALPGHAVAAGPFRVVIDAGHGGNDPGAISPLLPLTEKDIALDVALRLGAALQRRGVQVTHTRTDDRDVALAERAALAARVGAQALVSVHLNSAPNAAASGAEAWHGSGERDGELAAALLDGVAPALRRQAVGMRGTRAGPELAVLRTPVPAALIELGYVTNPTDARALSVPTVRADVAEGLAEGLVRFRDGRTQARPQVMLMGMGGGPGSPGFGLPGLYFVRPGDTLRAIAGHLGVPDAALRILDGGAPAREQPLQVGQPLQIAKEAAGAVDRAPVRSMAAPQVGRGVPSSMAARSGPAPRGSYVVANGDTLTRIASGHGVSVRDLVAWNDLADPDLIKTGQQLRLAASSAATGATGSTGGAPAGVDAGRHLVRAGETLSHVALMWGTTVEAVQRANGLADADHVEAGRVLVRPKS